jgi:hypothetical protein
MTCVINLAKVWLHVESKYTWAHLVDASIKTMKYLKGPHNGCIGPQISPWIRSRNLNGSAWILSGEGRKISFHIAYEEHTKSLDFRILSSFKSWPVQFPIIFHIIPIPGWPRCECKVENISTFWKITLYTTYGTCVYVCVV